MTVGATLALIAADWVALTPPVGHLAYEHASFEDIDPDSTVAERTFWFGMPRRLTPLAMTGSTALVEYEVKAQLALSDNGDTLATHTTNVADESGAFARAIEVRSVWAPAAHAVQVDNVEVERTASGTAIVELTLRVLVDEA